MVVDLRSLKPLDMATILSSVEKTGRCVIVHEAAYTGGFGAEIAARLAERGLLSLLAPVERVTGYDTIIPLFRLEDVYMPTVERVVAAARRAVGLGRRTSDAGTQEHLWRYQARGRRLVSALPSQRPPCVSRAENVPLL